MNKQIIIILVIIALMLLATMPTATSDANGGGKVWSDGYVGLTLNKIYRTDTVPPEFIRSPVERARPLEVGHDFVNINLTVTSIKGRHVLWFGGDNEAYSFLFDAKGDKYRVNFSSIEAVKLEYRGGGRRAFHMAAGEPYDP